jgi:serine/threonine protein kinase
MATLDQVDLARYRLGPVIGEGADHQVFAATDLETHGQVVLKRPHPTLVVRGQHRGLEEQTVRMSDLRVALGADLPHVARLVGVSKMADHAAYFGDSLANEYTVTVEERARGVPLVGSVVDGLTGHPIGAALNLFCLYPLATHPAREAASVVLDVLSVVERFHLAGVLLMDLRPQNVFYAPGASEVTIVDVGAGRPATAGTSRHPPVDIHDLFLGLFRWYCTPDGPPADSMAWGRADELELPPAFDGAVARLAGLYEAVQNPPERDGALGILQRIGGREYAGVGEFSDDLRSFLEVRAARLRRDGEASGLWQEALSLLEQPYWTRYLFDPATELAEHR